MMKLVLASLVLALALAANATGQEEFVNKTLYDLDMGGIGLDMQSIQDQVTGFGEQLTNMLNSTPTSQAPVKDRVIFNGSNGVYSISGMMPEGKTVEFNGDNNTVSWSTWNGSKTSSKSVTMEEVDASANSQVGAPIPASIKSSVSSSIPVQYGQDVDSQARVEQSLVNGPVYVRGTVDNGVFYPGNGSVIGFIDLDPVTGQQRFSDAS